MFIGSDVSILPRLATGIEIGISDRQGNDVSILPRLATGILESRIILDQNGFLFFPVLRRGSRQTGPEPKWKRFYSSPSCDGDPYVTHSVC